MSWLGQIVFDAYLVFVVASLAVVFATIMLATAELSASGRDGNSSEVLPDRKTTGPHRR